MSEQIDDISELSGVSVALVVGRPRPVPFDFA
jgi:hypothetical protein